MPIDRATTLRNAEKLLRQGKLDAAIAEYVRVVDDQPRDWNTANVLGDLYVRAGQSDRAVEQFVRIADHLTREGFLPKAGAIFKKILKLKPDDEHALLQSAEIAAAQGLLADARALFTSVGERRRRRGDVRGASEIRVRVGTLDPNDFDARAVAARARADMGDAAGAVVDLTGLADDLVAKAREAEAVEALRQAVGLAPEDGALRDRLFRSLVAAGQLDRAREHAVTVEALKTLAATLEADGRDVEALDLLRDAARRDPADAGLRARLARTFVQRRDLDAASEFLTAETAAGDPALQLGAVEMMLSEPDPYSLIAERLSGQSPFTSTDPSVSDLPGLDEALARIQAEAAISPPPVPTESTPRAAASRPPAFPADNRHFALGPNAVDLQALLEELEPKPAREAQATDAVEIDLSVVLDTFKPARAPIVADDLAGVFQQMRQEASGDRRTAGAEEQLANGLALQAWGRIDESIASLKEAARAPRVRFRAASALGRLYRQRGEWPQAIEWLERAAEAPPASLDEGHALLYELGELLESLGEMPRALAVWIELQADAGEYRDVAVRVDHLSKALSRG